MVRAPSQIEVICIRQSGKTEAEVVRVWPTQRVDASKASNIDVLSKLDGCTRKMLGPHVVQDHEVSHCVVFI